MMKGVSPTVSFVLVVAIIVTLTMSAYWWASSASGQMAEPGRVANLESQMVSLDSAVRAVAHGDINFSESVDVYHPLMGYESSTLSVIPDTDKVTLVFRQNVDIIGASSNLSVDNVCEYGEGFVLDNDTGIALWKGPGINRVFKGAQAQGPGVAEIALCYYDIDLVWAGNCMTATTQSMTTVVLKKTGVSGGIPVVEIDLC